MMSYWQSQDSTLKKSIFCLDNGVHLSYQEVFARWQQHIGANRQCYR